MKKIIKSLVACFTIVLILCSGNVYSAAKWVEVFDDNKDTMYIDSTKVTVHELSGEIYIEYWLRDIAKDEKNVEYLERSYLNVKNLDYKTMELYKYKNGEVVEKVDLSGEGWQKTLPDSVGEKYMTRIIDWTEKNMDKVTLK